MYNKIMVFTLASIFCYFQVFAFENPNGTVKVTPVGEAIAKKLIRDNAGNITLKGLKISDNIEPEQSFEIKIGPKIFYIISAHRATPSNADLFTCSVLLFDAYGVIRSAFDTMGNDNEKRPWYCDHVEAMSFNDYYPDGASKIIGLYRGTPPSSEHFVLPIIMKLDFNTPTLEIDEELTRKLEDVGADTIRGVRSYLKKQGQK